MAYKKIIDLYKEKMKFNKNGDAIITLPPGTDRIQFQYDDKDGTVKDQQFKILLSEVREIKTDVKRIDKKVDDLSGRVDDLSGRVDGLADRIDNIVDKNNLSE